MARPDPDVVAMLESHLAAARRGEVRDVFVLCRDGSGEYNYDYLARDLPDMLYELGTVILTERVTQDHASDPAALRPS